MIEKSNSTSLALATIAILGQPPSSFVIRLNSLKQRAIISAGNLHVIGRHNEN